MRRLVSPFILDQVAAGPDGGGFDAATLFVDVSGFSRMTSDLLSHGPRGAEVGAQAMRALFAPLVEAVYAQRGFITGFAGDSFTAVFPAAHSLADSDGPPDCLLHALAAAGAMARHVGSGWACETPWGRFEMGVKIGLAAGPLQWGIIRYGRGEHPHGHPHRHPQGQPHGRAAFYFRGPAIDACAAADAHTLPGELVLHPSCTRQLACAVQVMPLTDGFARVIGVNFALPTPQPPDLPTVDRSALAAFLPDAIIDQTEVGEFREAVNVFVNLQGDPSDRQLRDFVAVVSDLQAEYGGQFNRIDFGDKGCNLLMFWGAPVSHEDDVSRALGFLLDLRDRARIPLRVGVTSGLSHAGFVGSELHAEFTCYGQGLNLAARLMTSAPWGDILLDAAVQRRAATRFVLEFAGNQRFKGFAEAQAVYRLVDRRRAVEMAEGGTMVGRQSELDALANFVEPVREGRFAGMFVVQGDAGMGKSRLVSEFLASRAADAAAGSRLRVFTARAESTSRQPFGPFRYWLRNHFARNPRAPDADNKRMFEARLDALASTVSDPALERELERVRSVLGALVDLHWDGSLYARLDPRGRYENTLDALSALLRAECRHRPAVLVLEDVHWLDDGSVQALHRLWRDVQGGGAASSGAGCPLAVLATARPNSEPLFGAGLDHRTVALEPLSRTELWALATHVLRGQPAPDLIDLVIARSAGNPFFAERVLTFLRDDDKLLFVDNRWSVHTAALAAAPLPSDVKLLFVAHLDRLGQGAKEVVHAASVLGREFDTAVLTELMRDSAVEPAVERALEAARAAGLWNALGTTRHAFRHILLRDAAYDMQIQARRAQLHQRAAASIETVWASDLAPHASEIAHHHETAFQLGVEASRQPAAAWLTRAGTQAATTFASAAAADLFTRALALTPEEDLAGRFHLLLEREGAFDLQGHRTAQAEDVAALEALADRLGHPAQRAEAALRRTYLSGDQANFARALAASNQALAWAREAGLVPLQAAALRTAGASLRVQGRFDEALDHFERAIAVAKSAKLAYQEGAAWTAWSSLSVRRGNWKAAVAALERVVRTFEDLGHPVRVAHALSELGMALLAAGRLTEAQARFEQALAVTREVGDRAGEVPPLYTQPLVLIALGEYRRADDVAAEAIERADALSNAYMRTRGWMARGRVALLSGDRDAAERFVTQAGHAADAGYPDLRSWVLAHRAALALDTGRDSEALSLAGQAVEIAHRLDDRDDLEVALIYRSLAHEALGQFDDAEAGFRECIDRELATGAVPGRAWDGRAGLVRLRLAQGRADLALAEAEPIVAHLAAAHNAGERGHGLALCEQPMRVCWSAYQVLSGVGDPRSDLILGRSVGVLEKLCEQFDETARRERFRLGIRFHRDLLDASHARRLGIGASQDHEAIEVRTGAASR
jgi:class 3 adenylate cyclase/tetratricopeptide (TPR) repeat protein